MNRRIRIVYVGGILVGEDSATGNTLQHLFSGLKEIEIMQVFPDFFLRKRNLAYPVIRIDKRKSFTFCLIKGLYRRFSHRRSTPQTSCLSHKNTSIQSYLRGWLDNRQKRLGEDSIAMLDHYSPMIVYTLAENISVLRLSNSLSRRYNIPIVIHPMDNQEETLYSGSWLLSSYRKKYLQLLNESYSRSKCNLAISPKMAKVLSERHGRSFSFVMNCIDQLHLSSIPFNSPLRLVFSGGIHGGRLKSLCDLGRVICEDPLLKNHFQLYVYTSNNEITEASSLLLDYALVKPYVPRQDYWDNLSKADILVHVESFEIEEIDYFKYSLSTKIPEYLSTGRPLLCYGPSEMSTVSYLEDKGIGIMAHSISELHEVLFQIVSDSSLLLEYGQKAEDAANDHLCRVVTGTMKNVFLQSIALWDTSRFI